MALVCGAGVTAWYLLGHHGELLNLPTMVALYTVATQGDRRRSVIVAAVGAAWAVGVVAARPSSPSGTPARRGRVAGAGRCCWARSSAPGGSCSPATSTGRSAAEADRERRGPPAGAGGADAHRPRVARHRGPHGGRDERAGRSRRRRASTPARTWPRGAHGPGAGVGPRGDWPSCTPRSALLPTTAAGRAGRPAPRPRGIDELAARASHRLADHGGRASEATSTATCRRWSRWPPTASSRRRSPTSSATPTLARRRCRSAASTVRRRAGTGRGDGGCGGDGRGRGDWWWW